MKIPFKKAFILSVSSAACFLLMRILQLVFCVEAKTGFFKAGFIGIGTELSVVIFVITLICTVFSFLEKKAPAKFPETSLPLAVGYLVLGAGVILDLIFFPATFSAMLFQKIIYLVFGTVSAATLILAGITYFFKFKVFNFSSEDLTQYREFALPVMLVFWILRVIIFFSFYTEVAVISDLVFEILALLSVMVLLLYLSFFINRVENVKTEKRLLPLIILAFLTNLCASLPKVLVFVFGYGEKLHSLNINNITSLFVCAFLGLFYFYVFKEENLKEKTRRHTKETGRFIK